MRLRRRSSKKIKLLLLCLLAVAGFFTYRQVNTPKNIDAPQTLQADTPAKRDAAREKYLISLRDAIRKYSQAHGSYPFVTPKAETGICNGTSAHCKQVKLIDLNVLVTDGIILSIPSDPNGGKGQYNSGFSIRKDAAGIVLLAPRTEGPTVINIKL